MTTPCRYNLSTSLGDLDGSRGGFLALSVDGSVLARVKTQSQLAKLEKQYGSVILLDAKGDTIEDVVAALSDPESKVGVSRQGNQREIIDAALDAARRSADSVSAARNAQGSKIVAAITGTLPPGSQVSLSSYELPPEGKTEALITRMDSFMSLSSGLSPATAALLGADIPSSLSPSPDPGRTPICRQPQDPGATWKSSWERASARALASDASSKDRASGLISAGSMIHARAYALALGEVSSLLSMQTGESPGDAFYRLSGDIAVQRLREGALLRAGDTVGASIVSEKIHDLRAIQERFMLSYVKASRELLREVRGFGNQEAKQRLVEYEAQHTSQAQAPQQSGSWFSRMFAKDVQVETAADLARRAVDYLPSSWLSGIPKIEVSSTDSFATDVGGGNELGGFYRPPNEWSCVQDLLALNSRNPDRALGTAVHELVHVAQYYNESLQQAELQYLSSYQQEEPTVTIDGLTEGPVPAGRYHVRHVVPGDPYANVCATNTTLIAAIATSGTPTAPHEAAAMMHSNIELNEFLPQFAAWMSYAPLPQSDVVSGESDLKQWRDRLWLANPEAVSFGLGLFSAL